MADPAAAHLRRGEPGYPERLLDLGDPPPEVFARGTLPGPPAVAIVGSRAATDYGRRIAHRLAADLARLGIAVVSGLARGIDAAAHEGALEAGGATLAVLPGGLTPITPPSHAPLARRILARGALLAEWESGQPAYRALFIRRNRLIAALADVTVVVEAAERSGALSTAGVARRLGRPVLAVPGDVDRVTSQGCHALLREGARVCEGLSDVLAAMREPRPVERAVTPRGRRPRAVARAAVHARQLGAALAPNAAADTHDDRDAARLEACLDERPLSLESLAARSGVPVARALAALLQLEWAGVAVPVPGQRFARRASRVAP